MTKVAWEGPNVEKRYTVSMKTGTSAETDEASAKTEHDRFESLTKGLLTVSKTELDAKREEA